MNTIEISLDIISFKTSHDRLWEYRNGAFVNVNSGKVLDIKGGEIEPNGE